MLAVKKYRNGEPRGLSVLHPVWVLRRKEAEPHQEQTHAGHKNIGGLWSPDCSNGACSAIAVLFLALVFATTKSLRRDLLSMLLLPLPLPLPLLVVVVVLLLLYYYTTILLDYYTTILLCYYYYW